MAAVSPYTPRLAQLSVVYLVEEEHLLSLGPRSTVEHALELIAGAAIGDHRRAGRT